MYSMEDYLDINRADDVTTDDMYYDFDIDPLGIREAVEEQLYKEARAEEAKLIETLGYDPSYDDHRKDYLENYAADELPL